jgi:hypothetical protein
VKLQKAKSAVGDRAFAEERENSGRVQAAERTSTVKRVDVRGVITVGAFLALVICGKPRL